MLKKLIKYDLKYMYKFLIIFYGLIFFFSLTTRLILSLKQTIIVDIIGKISMGCLFSMMVSAIINTIMRNWVRFKQTVYGDESYLTHTLPVSKKDIYESKFLVSLINLFTTFIIVIVGLFIAFYNDNLIINLKNIISDFCNYINISPFLLILSLLLVLFLEIYDAFQSGFLGIILGHKKNNNKILFSVLYGFVIYILGQLFILISLFLISLFNENIRLIFISSTIENLETVKLIALISIILYTFVNIVINYISVKQLSKGVDVE